MAFKEGNLDQERMAPLAEEEADPDERGVADREQAEEAEDRRQEAKRIREAELRGEGKEVVESREQAVSLIRDAYKQRLYERFSAAGERPLEYHDPEHSIGVAERTRQQLEFIRSVDETLVSEEAIDLAELKALAHDLRQDGEETQAGMLDRYRGAKEGDVSEAHRAKGAMGNERASALEHLEELGRYVYPDGTPVFPVEDPAFQEQEMDDIATTFPAVTIEPLPSGKPALKIGQPHLTPQSSVEAFAIAKSDIAGPYFIGEDAAENLLRDGKKEFRELNPGIRNDIEGGIENLTPERRAKIVTEGLKFINLQPGVAEWQQLLFEQALEEHDAINGSRKAEEIKAGLRQKFSGFQAAIEGATAYGQALGERFGDLKEAANHAGNEEGFKEFLREVGYAI